MNALSPGASLLPDTPHPHCIATPSIPCTAMGDLQARLERLEGLLAGMEGRLLSALEAPARRCATPSQAGSEVTTEDVTSPVRGCASRQGKGASGTR